MTPENDAANRRDVWLPFENWSDTQLGLIARYEQLLAEANKGVNLVSRATVADMHSRHIVHSLALSVRDFKDGSTVVDWGSGGGLPGIPLAIRFPKVTFHLVESILKKTRALETFQQELGLNNVVVHRMRAEEWKRPIDYAVSRATASLSDLWKWTRPHLKKLTDGGPDKWGSGLVVLKGGDLGNEIGDLRRMGKGVRVEQLSLEQLTGLEVMEGKVVVSVRPKSR